MVLKGKKDKLISLGKKKAVSVFKRRKSLPYLKYSKKQAVRNIERSLVNFKTSYSVFKKNPKVIRDSRIDIEEEYIKDIAQYKHLLVLLNKCEDY